MVMDNIVIRSENIRSITDFKNFSSDNGIFVRIVGEDGSLLSEISKMDSELSLSAISGNIAYKRISSLPNISAPEDITFYTECYSEWIRCGRKRILARRLLNSDKADEKLASAISTVIRQQRLLRPALTDSMEKNAVIKLLFRFDEVMKGFADQKGFYKNAKLVADNITKEQDYLFFYMCALLGINVLLIQNRSDIDTYQKQLKLSAVTVTGHLGQTMVPEYREPKAMGTKPHEAARSTLQNTNDNINFRRAPGQENRPSTVRVTIPPRPQKRKSAESVPQTAPVNSAPRNTSQPQGIRVAIPPRPGRTTVGTPASGNMIPPSGNSTIQTQPQNRLRIPPPPVRKGGNSIQPSQTMRTAPMYNNLPDNRVNVPPLASAQRRELSYEQIARLAVSIVQILVFRNNSFGGRSTPDASGSGIMIGSQGYILTNCHVTDSGRLYGVRIENDNNIYYTDRVIKYHRNLDLSVIRIDRRLQPLPIYKGKEGLSRGQRVVAIGSPLGLFNTVSDGIISAFREIDGVNMIQFTAPISAGSSGGAVLNMYGEVVGISTAGFSRGQNINLAVPYDEINMFCFNFFG